MTNVDQAIEATEGLLEETHAAVLRAEVLRQRDEIAALKAGAGRVVPELTDEEVDAYLWDRNHGLVDSDEDWVRWSRRVGRWAYALAASRLPASRVLKEGELAVSREDCDLAVVWYHAVQDLNPKYLEANDHAAGERFNAHRATKEAA